MPQIIELPERFYVGIRATITMTTFGVAADRLGKIFAWLAEQGAEECRAGQTGGVLDKALELVGEWLLGSGVEEGRPVPGGRRSSPW